MKAGQRIFLLFLLLGIVTTAAFLHFKERSVLNATSPELAPRPVGGDFTLDSADGKVSLKDFRGKVVLLYFGYTLCPDICPTSLSMTTMALNALDPAELAKVQMVFVSVDPERDSLDHLKTYGHYFHPNIVGVTGSEKAVADVARRYGASYRKVENNSAAGYLVDHSAFTYLINQEGALIDSLPHGAAPEVVLGKIREALAMTPAT